MIDATSITLRSLPRRMSYHTRSAYVAEESNDQRRRSEHGGVDQYSRLQRCARGARDCGDRRSAREPMGHQHGSGLPRGRGRAGAARPGLVHGAGPVSVLADRGRCQERGGNRRSGRGVPLVPHRNGAVARALEGDAPARLRAGRAAGHTFDSPACGHSRRGGAEWAGRDHRRGRMPRLVIHRHRARYVVEPAA